MLKCVKTHFSIASRLEGMAILTLNYELGIMNYEGVTSHS